MNGENTCYKQSVTAVVLRDNKVLLARIHTVPVRIFLLFREAILISTKLLNRQ